MKRPTNIGLFLLAISFSASATASTAPYVALEIVSEGRLATGYQRWMSYLKDFGFSNIRVRGPRPGDQPKVENRGTDESPRYYVTALLTSDNRLALPGRLVRYGQRAELNDWMRRLQAGGGQSVTQPRGAYGMTPKQWQKLKASLSKTVTSSTKDRSLGSVVIGIATLSGVKFEFSPGTRETLDRGGTVLDEMKGIAGGTALAAILRTEGLVLVPRVDSAERIVVEVKRGDHAKEHWPIGIKPDKSPGQLAPSLFVFLNAEINDKRLEDVIDILQPRIKTPILIDHNALELEQISLDTIVSYPARRTFYKRILDDLLIKLKLTSELRIDEAERPFLWITTARKH